ncbi:hypothetical protein [Pseudomonas sp. NBRC 111123]
MYRPAPAHRPVLGRWHGEESKETTTAMFTLLDRLDGPTLGAC